MIPINHEAIARYRQIRENSKRYSIQDECSHCEFFNNSIGGDDYSFSTHTTASNSETTMDWSATPPMSPRSPMRSRASKYHGDRNMKSPMQKSPAASVDRSLRNQGWVGGHTPNGFRKPKRTWKLKNPADEIYLTKI